MHNLIILTVFFFAVIYLLSNFLYAALWLPRQAKRGFKNYRALRRRAYPPVRDQLDALWKIVNCARLDGYDIPQEADDIMGRWLGVKRKFPKPSKKEK